MPPLVFFNFFLVIGCFYGGGSLFCQFLMVGVFVKLYVGAWPFFGCSDVNTSYSRALDHCQTAPETSALPCTLAWGGPLKAVFSYREGQSGLAILVFPDRVQYYVGV